jgi:lipopolysaccharide transport system ATP-binding protein
MSSEVMIAAQGIGKAFSLSASPLSQLMAQVIPSKNKPDFWALQALDLTIHRGDVVGVIGQNGSGKSTLLQMICGTLKPSCGEVQVHGRLAALLELGAGFNPNFTGWENIKLSAALYGLSTKEIESKLSAIEEFADIGEFIDKPVKTYSSGMFVRLAFAVIANIDADILVIDEALAVGDVFFTQKCMRFLKTFSQQGTILFVSNDSASVVSLCNKAILLEHGKMLAMGDPKTITEYYLKRQYERQQEQLTPISTPAALHNLEISDISSNDKSNDFGLGGVVITSCAVMDEKGLPVLQVNGITKLHLSIRILAKKTIHQPLIGFSVKDRLGQILFGGNSEQSNTWTGPLQSGQSLEAQFNFTVPGLTLGDYMISVAAGVGTAQEHVMHHWIHDAYSIRSSLPVQSGIMEIPLDQVHFKLVE